MLVYACDWLLSPTMRKGQQQSEQQAIILEEEEINLCFTAFLAFLGVTLITLAITL